MPYLLTLLLSVFFSLNVHATSIGEPQNPTRSHDALFQVDQGLTRIDPQTQRVVWRALPDKHLFEPTVQGQRVFIGSSDGLFALDANSGTLLWHRHPGHTLYSPIALGERLFSGSLQGEVLALEAHSGALRWRRQLPGWVYTPVWLDTLSGVLVTGGSDQTLWGLDPDNGAIRWATPLDQELVYRPAAFNDGVIVTTFAGSVTRFDSAGRMAWRQQDGVAASGAVVVAPHAVVAGMDGILRIRLLKDGTLIQQARLGGRITQPPQRIGQLIRVRNSSGVYGFFSLETYRWVQPTTPAAPALRATTPSRAPSAATARSNPLI